MLEITAAIMYTVPHDPRIFMTPVTGYDAKTDTYFPANAKELVFSDEKALIRHLAFHTETKGSSDPNRWRFPLIERQFAKGRSVRIWTVEINWLCTWTEAWDYWFHDTEGRTVDVNRFKGDVIKVVFNGNAAETMPVVHWKNGVCGKSHRGGWHHGRKGYKGGVSFYLRSLCEESFYDEDGVFICRWTPRSRLLNTAHLFHDWDWVNDGACRSAGWKNHKYSHQWEHNVREKEKHMKNRVRKVLRRGYDVL